MSGGDDWNGRKVASSRARWATRLPLPCALGCGRPVLPGTAWVVEHDPPRWVQRARGITRIDPSSEVGVSHRRCSDASGGRAAAQLDGRAGRAARSARLEQRRLTW